MRRYFFLMFVLLNVSALGQTGAKLQDHSALLQITDLETVVPPAVYFSGQTATVQLRNSGGVRWEQSKQTLFAMVDVSGYSSGLRDRYQFYILTDVPVEIAGHHLPPGAYGAGFLETSGLLVMDLGGTELFHVSYSIDPTMTRPRPLQVLASGTPGEYRLYLGRTYVALHKE